MTIEDIKGVNDTNSLSFVSYTGKAEDVVLHNITVGANMHKITFKNLTIDGQYNNAGILLNTPVTDISIDGCKIIANPLASSTSATGGHGIYLKGNTIDTSMNICIINNTIDGGYNGISIKGGSSASYENIRDIWIDSNTLTNQNNYVISLEYANINSVSHNILLSKTEAVTYWRGIYLSDVNISLVNANKIKQRSRSISYPNGIYMTTVNHSIPQPALITNNEVYIYATGEQYHNGIYALTSTNIKVLFNSVFVYGKGSSAFTAANFTNIRLTLKYNNLFAADSCYPVFFGGSAYQTAAFDVGYNNYYSPRFIGNADGNHNTIAEWQTKVKYDTTSFSIKPVFVDSTISLELSNYTDFLCVATPEVKKDIKGDNRTGITTTGCYSQFVPAINLALEEILDFGKQDMATDKDTVRVIMRNGGTTPVTSAVISYQFNGTTVHVPAWTGYLETGEVDTITLGELQYISGWNNFTVWIDSLVGLTDPHQIDDTLTVLQFFCDTNLRGTYVVGTTSPNANFSTIAEAVELMYRCGISAPVTFELEDSLYLEHVRLERPIPGSSAINTVTFISSSGKASDVTIQRPDDTEKDLAPFMLKDVSNIIISNLTLSALSPLTSIYFYAKGIILDDNCTNIEVNACMVILPKFGNPTSTSSYYSGIYTATTVNNIRILDNTIDGGVYGIYLRGTSTSIINNIYIANNNIPATDKGGIYIEYTDSITLINNVLQQRNEAEIINLQTFQGIYLSRTNKITVLQNRIKAAKGMYGIYLYTINEHLSVSDGLIANNEIMIYAFETTLTTAIQGIYVDINVKTQVYHNSILIEGISAGNGLHVVSSTGTVLDIQNNILGVATPVPSYPVYFVTPADAMQCNFAYNNYYSATNTAVGFLGMPSETLNDWLDILPADIHSVSETPFFVKTEINLNLQSNYGIACPVLQAVLTDIDSNPRTNTTTMGAYHYTSLQNDVLPYEILSPSGTAFDTVDVIISIYNLGTDTLKNTTVYWEMNGVSQTPFIWNGELAPNKISAPVTIGRIFPDKKTNEFVIWTATPNGVTDDNINNDTIRILINACSSALSGTYRIGATSPDFKTITEAINQLYGCGVSGPTIFQLDTGEFIESITLKGFISGSSAVNTITFTSTGEHYDSTTIRRASAPNEVDPTITLENVANIKFTNLKISGWSLSTELYSYAVAIALKDGCENIEFSNCYLEIPYFISPENNSNYSVISRTIGAGIPVSDIRILNNIISGGAYGIFHSGSSTGLKKDNNILVQGNEIINIDKYGIRFGTAENISILNNTITQRPFEGEKQSFLGIFFYLVTGDNIVYANRIKADSLDEGIDFTQSSGLIANNEIIGFKARSFSVSSGIYATAVAEKPVRIIHNSILIASTGGSANVYNVRGVYLGTSHKYELKNNHIVTMDSMSVPVYIATTYDSERYDVNYNNYYNPYHIGYVSNLKTTLADWKKTVTSDIHSLSNLPAYDTAQLMLRPVDTTGLTCPTINGVDMDIDGMARYQNTLRGAYTATVLNMDVAITDIVNIPTLTITGEKYTPSIRIKNYGTTPISEVVIGYALNGVLPASTKTWTGTLNKLEDIVFALDTLSSLFGQNDVVVWISSVNTLGSDDYQQNDTVRTSFNACDSLYSGSYIVGAVNRDFTSVMDGITKFRSCGVKGDIVLRLERGTYEETWNLTDLDFMKNYTLTITSLDNHKDSVILQPQGMSNTTAAIVMTNANNITVRHLTIDAATKAQKGIQFTGFCNNIIIDSCNILANPTATTNSFVAIDKAYYTGIINNLTITNNVIDGGYYGLSLYSGTGSSTRGNNIRIDSNIFTNAYYYSIFLEYANVTVSNNTLLSRKNATTSWYGIFLSYSVVNADANKIHFYGATNDVYGFYGSSISRRDVDIYSKITNNEIIITAAGTGSTGVGIYVNSSKTSILNNSILVKGTTAKSRGVSVSSSYYPYSHAVKNNNIVMLSPNAYPIHLGDDTYAPLGDINYNNYFAPQYIGLITSTAYSTLASWQAVVLSDRLSIREQPLFVDTAQSLELTETGKLRCTRHRDVLYDITGVAREKYTTMGAYSYAVMERDLALEEIVSPSNTGNLCSPSYLPVRYVVKNNGSEDCNFYSDSLKLFFSMTGPITFDTAVVINTGLLKRFAADTFELKNMLDVSYAGDYDIEAWIETNIFDTVRSNDTLRMTYHNTKIALPFDNDFSMFDLTSLTVKSVLKDSVWKTVDTNHHPTIKPYYGTGMLVFDGEHGTISQISTGQLELNRTHQPVLEFWYLHDNSNHEQEDQLDVRLTYDGGMTYTTLFNIMRHDSSATVPVWKKYFIDLSQYQDSSCVIVCFDGYSHGKAQYIDRIAISSSYDLSLSGAIISPYSVCDLNGKDVKVILTNETGQNIDFDKAENSTELVIEVTYNGTAVSKNTYPLTGLFKGLTSDTITDVSKVNLSAGTCIVTSYLTKSIDNTPANDIHIDTFIVSPGLSVEVHPVSNSAMCLAGETKIWQEVTLINSGNMDLSDIKLTLQIDTGEINNTVYTTFSETRTGTITAGDTVSYTFTNAYIVPWNVTAYVQLIASLACDTALVNSKDETSECIDMKDLHIVSIDNPSTEKDNTGESIYVATTLSNRSDHETFTNANITVLITNSLGIETERFTETKTIGILATTTHTFSQPYTVPNDTVYYLTVYTDNYDGYTHDDTMRIKRETNNVGIYSITGFEGFALGQNIPNPAKNATRIDYSVPEAGVVVFCVQSSSGQILYSKTIETTSGNNSLVLNTDNLSAGVYFYSIEYKEKRLVKRMVIKK
ncbi:MAG: right-handed parallel beta-helix repeat-containing protein [Bacteroidales bacterium]|nr:right-handed parallel beta-helix repeat-containing protein [Bacteroidales bacterium]